MKPIETVTRSLRCVLYTPQGQHYLSQGFTDEVGPPPTEPERAYLLRALRTTADTLQANRQPVRDMLEALFVQGSPATPGVVHLVSMLSRVARICHQAGHEWPDIPDDPGRPGVEWGTMEDYFTSLALMVSEYFPDLSIPPVVPVRATSEPAEATSEPAEAATGAGIGKPPYSLQTSHNRQELARIYVALVDAGYIDGSAPDAAQDFCNAFDPAADRQGRISWIWTDKRNREVCPRQILDFVAQMGGSTTIDGITREMCEKVAPAVFGLAIDPTILSKFRTRWNREKYCDTHADIGAILSGV